MVAELSIPLLPSKASLSIDLESILKKTSYKNIYFHDTVMLCTTNRHLRKLNKKKVHGALMTKRLECFLYSSSEKMEGVASVTEKAEYPDVSFRSEQWYSAAMLKAFQFHFVCGSFNPHTMQTRNFECDLQNNQYIYERAVTSAE